jgi:hypothetical protein
MDGGSSFRGIAPNLERTASRRPLPDSPSLKCPAARPCVFFLTAQEGGQYANGQSTGKGDAVQDRLDHG